MKILVQADAFDLGTEVDAMRQGRTDIGAIASFVGLARDINEGSGVAAMTLEHYPGMTEKALAALVDEASARWTLLDVTVIHRVGRLLPGDPIVLVAVASTPSRRSLRRLRIHHGLSEDPGAVLEEGRNARTASAGSMRAPATMPRQRAGINQPDLFSWLRQRARARVPSPQPAHFEKPPIAPLQPVYDPRQRCHAAGQAKCGQRLP